MKREWKSGDVAKIGWSATSGIECAIWNGSRWETETDLTVHPDRVTEARPLAVIDPEAPIPDEWIDLVNQASGHVTNQPEWNYCLHNALAALFAHIADPEPPRPDEPTGKYAVVRDGDDALWVRRRPVGAFAPWEREEGEGAFVGGPWEHITRPVVLFPGVEDGAE